MGRPPVDWTLSRKRKLTRLYLATDMHLEDICVVLRDEKEKFLPEPRKTQDILRELLQSNYERFRPKDECGKRIHGKRKPFANAERSTAMKTRMGELRQCRAIRTGKSPLANTSERIPSSEEVTRAHELDIGVAIQFDRLPGPTPDSQLFDSPHDGQLELGGFSTQCYDNIAPASSAVDATDYSGPLPNTPAPSTRPDEKRPASSEIEYSNSKVARRHSPGALTSESSDPVEDIPIRYDGRELSDLISRESLLARLCWKYSPSYVADVLSLRSRFSSTCSWKSRTSSKVFSVMSQEVAASASISSSQQSCRCHTQPCLHDQLGAIVSFCLSNNLAPPQIPQLSGVDIMATDPSKNGPLHIAAQASASLPVFEALINAGADIHAINANGQTFLHVLDPTSMLTRSWWLNYLLLLVQQHNFDLSARDHNGRSILLSLLEYRGFHDEPTALSTFTASLTSTKDLWLGSHCRDRTGLSVRTHLWQMRERTNKKTQSTYYGIMYELCRPFQEFARPHLLSTAAFTSRRLLRSSLGKYERGLLWDGIVPNSLRRVFHHFNDQLVEFSGGPGGQPAVGAFQERIDRLVKDFQERIDQLLEAGFDINAYDSEGCTPLMLPIMKTPVDGIGGVTILLVKHLIANGASIHQRNRQGKSILHLAVERGLTDIMELLIKEGANVNALTDAGHSMLNTAYNNRLRWLPKDHHVYARMTACMTILIDHGALAEPIMEWI